MAQTSLGAQKTAAANAGLSIDEFRSRVAAGLKRCMKCKIWRDKGTFNKDRSRHDGLNASCIECTRVKVRVCTKGRPSHFKGRSHTDATKQILSIKNRGRQPRLGIKHTESSRKKMSLTKRQRGVPKGPDHYAWKHGKFQRDKNDRLTPAYQDWRLSVFKRDGFACQKCGDSRGRNLRAHHIKSFADHPDLRFEISNGLTLCHHCHELEHYKPDSIRNERKLKRGHRLWGGGRGSDSSAKEVHHG